MEKSETIKQESIQEFGLGFTQKRYYEFVKIFFWQQNKNIEIILGAIFFSILMI